MGGEVIEAGLTSRVVEKQVPCAFKVPGTLIFSGFGSWQKVSLFWLFRNLRGERSKGFGTRIPEGAHRENVEA